jgi:protease-4
VKAVLLKINSPGGEVMASDDIYKLLADFQEESGKPVVASMGSLAASGGYYVAAPCRWIVANDMTITGSIGVIMNSFNFRGLMDKIGVRPNIYKSGRYKDMLGSFKDPSEVTPEESKMIQSLVDETFGQFKRVVSEGRQQASKRNNGNKGDQGRKLVENWVDYADGRVFSGKTAYEYGFVDELGNFEAAIDRAKNLARISEANVIQYQQRFDLSHLFRLLGKSDAGKIKIDAGIDVPRLKAGHLYFISPTLVQ